jgi:hypothetical protein
VNVASDTKLFNEIFSLEYLCKSERAGMTVGADGATRQRATRNHARLQRQLFVLLDSLSDDQLRSYAEFRKAQRA